MNAPKMYYGILDLYWETGFETCAWSLEETDESLKRRLERDGERQQSAYDALHFIEEGDTVIVGLSFEDFCRLQERVSTVAFPQRVYGDIVFDYDVNKVELAQQQELQRLQNLAPGLHLDGSAQRIDGNTVKGFPVGSSPEEWYGHFKNQTSAVLIKKPQAV